MSEFAPAGGMTVDPESEDIIRRVKELRDTLPRDALPALKDFLLRAMDAKTPAARAQIMDELSDPDGILSRAEKDKIIADAAGGDELAPRRLRRLRHHV